MLDNTAAISEWLGRQRTDDDDVSLGAVRRLAATLDRDPDAFKPGSELPEAWYAILFGPTARQSEIGADGHPRTGDFLPAIPGSRRMFAGRRTTFHKPLRVGDLVQRTSTVADAQSKNGRSGPLVIVTVVHELSTASAGLAVREEQDLVYRAPVEDTTSAKGAKAAPEKVATAAPDEAEWSRTIVPDEAVMFRYSALTFNAHRIHYDLPYAREAEGYPALVVNGGFTTLMLVEDARPHVPGRITGYAARAMRPLFVGQPMTVAGRHTGPSASRLWASGPDGAPSMQLDLTWAPAG